MNKAETRAKLITPESLRVSAFFAPLREIIRNYPKPFLRASVPPCEILPLCASTPLRDIMGGNK